MDLFGNVTLGNMVGFIISSTLFIWNLYPNSFNNSFRIKFNSRFSDRASLHNTNYELLLPS